jgi:hypothetical protein
MPNFAPTIVYPEGIYNSCGSPSRKVSNWAYDQLEKQAYQRESSKAFPIGIHTPSGKGNAAQTLPTPLGSTRVFSEPMGTPSGKASQTRPRPTFKELDEPPSPTPAPKKLKMNFADKAGALLSPGRPNPRVRSTPVPAAAEEAFEAKNLFKHEPSDSLHRLPMPKGSLHRPSTPLSRTPRVQVLTTATPTAGSSGAGNMEYHRPGTPDGGRYVRDHSVRVLKPPPGFLSLKKSYSGLGIGRPSHLAEARPGAR